MHRPGGSQKLGLCVWGGGGGAGHNEETGMYRLKLKASLIGFESQNGWDITCIPWYTIVYQFGVFIFFFCGRNGETGMYRPGEWVWSPGGGLFQGTPLK